MLLLGAATIIWFVTVRSGTCLFTTRATCRSHNDAYEATTVAPGHFVIDKTYAPPFFSSPSLCDLEPRRHLVSATVLDLRRNESLHMPVFSCSAVEVKKKGRWCCSLYYFASQDECVQKCSILGSFTVKQELHAVTFDVATYNQLNNHPGRKWTSRWARYVARKHVQPVLMIINLFAKIFIE